MEDERGVETADGMFRQGEVTALSHHDLSGKGESDARTCLFGGEEWDEDFASHFSWDGTAIVADEEGIVPAYIHALCACFDCVFHQVDDHLSKQVLVGVNDERMGKRCLPVELRIEVLDAIDEFWEIHVCGYRLLQLGEFSVAIDEGGESGTGVVDGANAFFVGRSLDLWTVHVCLRDAADGCGGIHDFVCQHPREAFPGFHFVLCDEAADVGSQVVERFLQGSLSAEESLAGQTEGEVVVAHGFAHEVCPQFEQPLMADEADDDYNDDDEDDDKVNCGRCHGFRILA